jgi:alcohol dehydrogenase class IV
MTNLTEPATADEPKTIRFTWPTRVLSGEGALDAVGPQAAALGSRAVVVTDRGVAAAGLVEPVEAALEKSGIPAATYDDVASDPSIQAVEGAAALLEQHEADVIVAVGGGSPIDTGKAAAMIAAGGGSVHDYEGFDRVREPTMPLIAIPTTIGTGSEVTRGAVISDKAEQRKLVIVDDHLYPRVALLDPRTVAGLPSPVAAATGMDALAHAVEGYTTLGATPLSDALCLAAVRIIGRQLRPAVAGDPDALYQMLHASCLAGAGFHNVGLGLAHSLASVLGGHYPVHHGVATGLFLPHVMRFNLISNLEKFGDVAEALGEVRGERSTRAFAARAPEAVAQLMADIGVPLTLGELEVPASAFPRFAEEALDHLDRPGNPRRNDRADLEELCRQAA